MDRPDRLWRMGVEHDVTRHYERGDLTDAVTAGLQSAGIDLSSVSPADLAPVDEFHIGGRPATEHFASKLPFSAADRLLDVGCGLGGAARYMAERFDATVTGIDLTRGYIVTANRLTELTGLTGRVQCVVGSALDMPFADATFDGAVTIHTAMNIQERDRLYAEVARVLRPGAAFGVYDLMKGNDQPIDFPVPWARDPSTSHLTTPDETQALLRDAGFEIFDYEDRTEHAAAFFEAQADAASGAGGPPPIGIHLLTGGTHREKFTNMIAALNRGAIAPGMIVARKLAG
jgi:SAM-dependent methyltransferase